MKALVLTDPGTVAWHDVAEPDLQGPGEALVEPVAVALCDLDHPMIMGRAPFPGPIALGHEGVGRVVAVGRDVATVAPGDLVVVPFQISCGACGRCERGITHSCASVQGTAMFGFGAAGGDHGGFLADLVRVPYADAMCVRLPAGHDPLRYASASDNVPDGWRTVAPHLLEWPGADVLVLGGGAPSVGLYAVAAARALDAGSVTYLDSDDARLGIASDLGADAIAVDGWPERAPRRAPIVVDAGSSHGSLRCALGATEAGGHLTHVGILFEPATELPLLQMFMRGIHFHTSRAPARAHLDAVLGAIASGRLRSEAVTSRVAAWDDAPAAVLQDETKLVLSRL